MFLEGHVISEGLAIQSCDGCQPQISALMSKYVEKFFQTVLSRPQSLCLMKFLCCHFAFLELPVGVDLGAFVTGLSSLYVVCYLKFTS